MERSSSSTERQYTLRELARSAGVSVRTIRYYIGEGLLPAPEGAGSQCYYTESHQQRLRAIGLLKDRFLPLREIRSQLAGLDDEEIEVLIAELNDPEESASSPIAASPAMGDAALDYIDSALAHTPTSRLRMVREEHLRKRTTSPDEATSWRRLEIADGAELLVRDDLYRRRKDQIDWLIEWAQKVVD